jgi:ABC-type transport system involved in Fe-S cluster assembly fused permease/ATPase subunit
MCSKNKINFNSLFAALCRDAIYRVLRHTNKKSVAFFCERDSSGTTEATQRGAKVMERIARRKRNKNSRSRKTARLFL